MIRLPEPTALDQNPGILGRYLFVDTIIRPRTFFSISPKRHTAPKYRSTLIYHRRIVADRTVGLLIPAYPLDKLKVSEMTRRPDGPVAGVSNTA